MGHVVLYRHNVPDPVRLHRCRSLRPGCQAQRPGPHALPPELGHLLQGQRRRRVRRLGPRPCPLGLLLPPLLDSQSRIRGKKKSSGEKKKKKKKKKKTLLGKKKKKKKKKKK